MKLRLLRYAVLVCYPHLHKTSPQYRCGARLCTQCELPAAFTGESGSRYREDLEKTLERNYPELPIARAGRSSSHLRPVHTSERACVPPCVPDVMRETACQRARYTSTTAQLFLRSVQLTVCVPRNIPRKIAQCEAR